VREFAPPASSIFVEDYASVHELAAHVRRVLKLLVYEFLSY
jgi:hypothetical protein